MHDIIDTIPHFLASDPIKNLPKGPYRDERNYLSFYFNNGVQIPNDQNQTVPEYLRVLPPDGYEFGKDLSKSPWMAPGTAIIDSPCGVAGGNPRGCDNDDIGVEKGIKNNKGDWCCGWGGYPEWRNVIGNCDGWSYGNKTELYNWVHFLNYDKFLNFGLNTLHY